MPKTLKPTAETMLVDYGNRLNVAQRALEKIANNRPGVRRTGEYHTQLGTPALPVVEKLSLSDVAKAALTELEAMEWRSTR